MISIQTQDFNAGTEYDKLAQGKDTGAVVTFVGRVRDFLSAENRKQLFIDHYAAMTESALREIIDQAKARWQIHDVTIIHRVGHLSCGDQIVFVGVAASHRKEAFAACEFTVDLLKAEAPFWKKEGALWLDAKTTDVEAAERWKDT